MSGALMLVLQAAADTAAVEVGRWQAVKDFVDSPAPYSPYSEYLLLLFVLWLLARRESRQTFDTQAQDVLDEKYAKGEITKKAYDKFRQEAAIRPKR